ncbi:hypothetical protein DL96DRAFT_126376 [Flagelloscypha sp. PMI_526]|nr:hypothetical protein DL96DRAFT_126376 [Flagelloscypha sp. PMI_526]
MARDFVLSLSLVFICLLSFVNLASAAAQNFSIDDTFGDKRTGVRPSYTGDWEQKPTPDCTCVGSLVCIPCIDLFRNTTHNAAVLHDQSQQRPQVTFNFTGSAIYVFMVQGNNDTRIDVRLDLDDGTNIALPAATDAVTAATLVYSNVTLPFGEHRAVITGITEGVVFDYALYTFQDDQVPVAFPDVSPSTTGQAAVVSSQASNPSSSPSSSSNSSAPPASWTIGATVGLLSFFVLVVSVSILVTLLRRRAERRGQAAREMQSWVIDDFNSPFATSAPLPSSSLQSTPVSTPSRKEKVSDQENMHETQRSLQNEIDTLKRQMFLMRQTSEPRDIEAGDLGPRTSYVRPPTPPPEYHGHSPPLGFGILGRISRRVTAIAHSGTP